MPHTFSCYKWFLFLGSFHLGCLWDVFLSRLLFPLLKFLLNLAHYDVQAVKVVSQVKLMPGCFLKAQLQSHPNSFAEHFIGVLVANYFCYTRAVKHLLQPTTLAHYLFILGLLGSIKFCQGVLTSLHITIDAIKLCKNLMDACAHFHSLQCPSCFTLQ